MLHIFAHRPPQRADEAKPGNGDLVDACRHGVRDAGMVVSLATCPVSRSHFGATDGVAPLVASGATIAS
jgi:hypothetical protein